MKKGINAWCFPGHFSIAKSMEVAKTAGFDGIELNMSEESVDGENLALTLNTTDEDILVLKGKAESLGLELPSLSTSLLWKYPLTHNEDKVAEKGQMVVRKMLHAAHILGADTILVVPGLVDPSVSYRKAYDRSLESLKVLARYAAEVQIHIGVENVWNKFLMSPLEMRRFIEEIDSPYVGAYFDAGNVLSFSYPEHWIEVLSDTIKKVHVKDFSTSIGNIHGFTNLLQGDVNWAKVVEALRAAGYDSYLTAELSPYRLFPEKLAVDTSDAMDKIFSL